MDEVWLLIGALIILVIFSLISGIENIIKCIKKKKVKYFIFGIILILFSLSIVIMFIMILRDLPVEPPLEVKLMEKCLATDITVTNVLLENNNYVITLSRRGAGDVIGGVKLNFTNNFIEHVAGNIVTGHDKIIEIPANNIANSNKVSVVVYYLDEKGREYLCQTASEFKFA
jgi:hypothetical protein